MRVLFWLLVLAFIGCLFVAATTVGEMVNSQYESLMSLDAEDTEELVKDKRWNDNVIARSLTVQASLVFAVVFAVQAIIVRKINKISKANQGLKT